MPSLKQTLLVLKSIPSNRSLVFQVGATLYTQKSTQTNKQDEQNAFWQLQKLCNVVHRSANTGFSLNSVQGRQCAPPTPLTLSRFSYITYSFLGLSVLYNLFMFYCTNPVRHNQSGFAKVDQLTNIRL